MDEHLIILSKQWAIEEALWCGYAGLLWWECITLPIIYHWISAALSAKPKTFKVDSLGTHQWRGSWLPVSYFQYGIKVCSSSAPCACKKQRHSCFIAHRDSDLLGILEACAAHRCKGWILLANEPTTTYLPAIHQSPARRAACVWSTSHHHSRLGLLPPL